MSLSVLTRCDATPVLELGERVLDLMLLAVEDQLSDKTIVLSPSTQQIAEKPPFRVRTQVNVTLPAGSVRTSS
jgi:hypothetical protein